MWSGDLNTAIIVDIMIADIERFITIGNNSDPFNLYFNKSLNLLGKQFPQLTSSDLLKMLEIVMSIYNRGKVERVELVLTAPAQFNLKARKTHVILYDLLKSASTSILMTGYSISDYVDDLMNEIIEKSKKGVQVNIYIDNLEKKKEKLDLLLAYKGKFLNIYDYNCPKEDAMSALHAKIIVVDKQKSLITSSNLSYHGIKGNIELGVLIDSRKKAVEIGELFQQLRKQKVFVKI